MRAIILYEFKLNASARQTAEKLNAAFGPGTTSDVTIEY